MNPAIPCYDNRGILLYFFAKKDVIANFSNMIQKKKAFPNKAV